MSLADALQAHYLRVKFKTYSTNVNQEFFYMQDVNSQIYEPLISANLSSSDLDFLNIAYLAMCARMSFSNAHDASAKYLLRHPTFLPALRTISSQSPKYINYSMSIIVLHAALSKYHICNCNKYIYTGYI